MHGFAKLVDPEGNVFFGEWRNHKRFGRGIQFKMNEKLFLLEFYEADGKLAKRLKRAEQKADRIHWKIP